MKKWGNISNRLSTIILVGVLLRLAIAPFFAHPLDIFTWFISGERLLSGKATVSDFLIPYDYSFFLFAFPASAIYEVLTRFIPSFTISVSSLNPILNPGAQWGITIIPGILYDTLVKLPLIVSDSIITVIIYKIVRKYVEEERTALFAASLWFLNPFVIWVSSGWGMFDTLPTLFTLMALYLELSDRFVHSGVSMALAIAMKYYAFVLIFPLIVIAHRRGKHSMIKTLTGLAVPLGIFLIPDTNLILSSLSSLATGTFYLLPPISSGSYYSGLSFWSAITLFFVNFNPTALSGVLSSFLLVLAYSIIWRNRNRKGMFDSVIFFVLPLLSLLAGYRFVAENFVIWVLPFLSIVSLGESLTKRLTISISTIAFVSSITNSLLPYYLLPTAPWLGRFLVFSLRLVSSFRVAPGGTVVSGITFGKIFLAAIGVSSSIVFLLIIICLIKAESNFSIRSPETLVL